MGGIDDLDRVHGKIAEETSYRLRCPQPRLFGLDALGEGGWLKAFKLDEYAPRRSRKPPALQQVLFTYMEAI